MKYIDYVQLSPIEKFTYKLSSFFKAIPGALAGFFSAIGKFLKSFVQGIGNFFKDYATYFKTGGPMTKLSYVVMGAGCLAYGQVVKGIIFLLAEILFIVYMATFGGVYISKFGTLGTVGSHVEMSEDGFEINVPGDDSMLILLFGTLTLVLIVVFIAVGTDFENIVDMISHVRLKISRKQQSISVRHQLARTSEDRLAAVIIGSAVRKKYNHLLPPSVVLIFLTLLYRPMLYPHKIVNKPYCS